MKIHESGDISRVTKEQIGDVLLKLDEQQTKGLADGIKGLFDYEEARQKADRIRAICENEDSTFDDALEAIAKEGDITPFIALHLALGTARVLDKMKRQNTANAQKKGEIWRRAAIEEWNRHYAEYKSLSEFAQDKAGTTLRADDGQAEDAPKYRTVYDVMLKAKKDGKLKP